MMVPFGKSGAASSLYTYCFTQLWSYPAAVEREVVCAPDRLDAHPRPRRVEVWLEGDDLGVLPEHGKGMEFLTCSPRHDVDVGAVAEPHRGPVAVFGRVSLWVKNEAELEMRGGLLDAVRVNMARAEMQGGIRLQEGAELLRENIGVAPHLVNGPARAGVTLNPRPLPR